MNVAAPRATFGIVSRSRLDERFNDTAGRLVRVLAPGGYGKSTLVRRWVANDWREVRWLDLERVDNEAVVLTDALRRALSGLTEVSFDDLPPVPSTPRELAGVFLPAFGSLVRSCRVPFVLVLDDIHHVDARASAAIIETLAKNLPAASTLILAGRAHDWDESIGRLRMSPGVTDVTVEDLAFDLAETEEMMSSCGVEVDLGAVTELAGLFEGWPAALRLAALVLHADHRPPQGSLSDLGDASYVVDFLRSAWSELAHEDLQFLTEVACLDRFSGEMCDSVLGRLGCAPLLRRLHRQHLVVMPLDHGGEWYRMHPLLARWLSTELKGADRARWCQVHCDAARWRASVGDIDIAITHAARAGAIPLRQALIVSHAGDHLGRSHDATVRAWLADLPADHLRSSPDLGAVAGLVELLGGDGEKALHWSHLASRSRTSGDDSPADSSLATLLSAAVEPAPASATLPVAERARQLLTSGSWRALACWTLGNLMFLDGDEHDERAVDVLGEGAFEAGIAGAHTIQAGCLVTRGIILDLHGEIEALGRAIDSARELFVGHRVEPSATTTLVEAATCLVDARRGYRDSAARLVSPCRSHLAGYGPVAPWYNVLTRLVLARACLLLDDATSARVLMREIDHHLRFEHDGSGAARHVERLWADVTAANELRTRRSWSLTPAELRVVQFLPSNLSLADIATRLFVSRNTVKSHVAAIYRKLGTTSRSRAVELAREAGFLPADSLRLAQHS